MKSLLVLLTLTFATTVFAADHTVVMKSISFEPKVLTVKTGDTVTWTNESYTAHSATGEGFDTDMVEPKKTSKKIAFDKVGRYPYHCMMHGKSMSGEVVVQ